MKYGNHFEIIKMLLKLLCNGNNTNNNDSRNWGFTQNGRKRLIFIVVHQSFVKAVTECKKLIVLLVYRPIVEC